MFASLLAGEIRLLLLPGVGMAHGGAQYDVPLERVPPALRLPNTPLWVQLDQEFNVVKVWRREVAAENSE